MRYDIMKADEVSTTGLIYSAKVVQQVREHLERENVFVVLDAPADSTVNIERVVGQAVKPEIIDGVLSVELNVLNTPLAAVYNELDRMKFEFEMLTAGTGSIIDRNVHNYSLSCCYLRVPRPVE